MLLIGGTFDQDGGKPSYIIQEMFEYIKQSPLNVKLYNGGKLSTLYNLLDSINDRFLLWMPNVDNAESKILPEIKVRHPKLFLISSKRSIEKTYNEWEVICRLLKTHSNLGIMIEKGGSYNFKLIDPLGNIFCNTKNIETLCDSIIQRVLFLSSMRRIGSKKISEREDFVIKSEFIKIIREYGKKFSEFVNAWNPNRLLGNASTRCCYGFPAEKNDNGTIYVSQRNINKELINSNDFVEVKFGKDNCVEYKGNSKPSVDTPVQLMLFEHFKNIKYMIHGHVYVKDAPFTNYKIPCGYIEEFKDIKDVINNKNVDQFSVNLKGHGCLIACKNPSYFGTVELIGRNFPEY